MSEPEKIPDSLGSSLPGQYTGKTLWADIDRKIQAPVNGLAGIIERLEQTCLDDEQLEYIRILKNTTEHLQDMLSGIQADVDADIDQGAINTIDFDLRTTIAGVRKHVEKKIRKKQVSFEVHIHHLVPSLLKGDPEKLRRILYVLLENAIQYTEKGRISISIVLGHENKTHAHIRFEVADTGTGIEKGILQSHGLLTGIRNEENSQFPCYRGLEKIAELVRLMQGEITADSTPGKGSIFRLALGFEKQIPAQDRPRAIKDGLKHKRVLVVDADDAQRLLVKEYLLSWGCLADEAVNADRAAEKLDTACRNGQPFDMMLIDMQLPKADGESLARTIRSDIRMSQIVIIMLAALGKPGDVARLRTIGVQGYLPKPLPAALLFDCMSLALNRAENQGVITRHFIQENKKQQFKLMLIDPVKVNQKIAKNILEKSGYRLSIFKTPLPAIAALKKQAFDMVFVEDHQTIRSEETIKELRQVIQDQERKEKPTAFILITEGYNNKEASNGYDDTISKPLTARNLLALVEQRMGLVSDQSKGHPLFQRARGLKKTKDIFDLQGALERAMDDKTFLQELLDEFIRSFPGKHQVLQTALQDNNFKTFTQCIYSLRSSALNIGAAGVSQAAMVIEKHSDAGDFKSVNTCFNRLEEEFERFSSHIDTIDWSKV